MPCVLRRYGRVRDGRDRRPGSGEPVTAEQNAGLVRLRSAPTSRAAATAAGRTRPHPAGLSECDTAGGPFKIVDNDLIPFRLDVAKRIADLNTAIGRPADTSIPAADRAQVRLGRREFFFAEHGREPVNAQELAGQIAKGSRPRPRPLLAMT